MAGFLKKLFGKGKSADTGVEGLVKSTLETLFEKAGFDLNFDVRTEKSEEETAVMIELSGPDEDLVTDREGQMIDALQLFLKRVVQNNFPEDKSNIVIDCNGYREESNQALLDLADKLKGIALEKGKSVYFRALPPKDRKVIHQYLSNDARVKSRSIGDGLYKKIKIYPVKNAAQEENSNNSQ